MDYTTLKPRAEVEKVITNLKERNIEGFYVETKEDALNKIKEWIPAGASVMNGSSTTLQEIGYIDYLKSGQHGWNNLHEKILAEKDQAKQAKLRRESVLSDYYLGSVHALSEAGELVIASNTGSQMPHIVYTSPNLIFVVSTEKIMPTLEDAQKRLVEHVVPLEDKRMMAAYKTGTRLSKELIFNYETPFNKRNIRVLFVNERAGF
jgi:L-lactate utilization protein LutB